MNMKVNKKLTASLLAAALLGTP
ncbi:MAG: hypothetical protein K0Q63_3500, partial [Paenibacillus sp.]|nr:hypothetical protein [Paenibacillus sp.]